MQQLICPACNGLAGIRILCSVCQHPMTDQGRVSDYYGNYSPYRVEQDNPSSCWCTHLYYCEQCRNDARVSLPVLEERDLIHMSPEILNNCMNQLFQTHNKSSYLFHFNKK